MTEPRVLLAPNPSLFTGRGTNTYLLGEGGGAICIDPGPDDDRHLEAILAAIEPLGRLDDILLSHSHPDHRPLARRLAGATGARVWALEPDRGDDGALPLVDGGRVAVGGIVLEAVHTPGHAADHLCYFERDSRALYSGDHLLQGMTSVIAPPDGDMADYLRSLERVRALQPRVIHPGHGERVADAQALIDEYLTHRRQREAEVVQALRDRGHEVVPADLVPEIYAAYPRELWPLAAGSVEAHLDKLAAEGRVRRRTEAGRARYSVR